MKGSPVLIAAGATIMSASRWKQRYEVWLQERGRDGDEHLYAARCRDCPPPQGMTDLSRNLPWLTETASSRADAWSLCRRHESEKHG